jgi:hypothetical protein
MTWYFKGGERAKGYKMIPYKEGMLYFDSPEENKKAVVIGLEDLIRFIKEEPSTAKRCGVLREYELGLSDKEQKHIKCTGLHRIFLGEFDLSSGRFTDSGLIDHPGVMCFDADKLTPEQVYFAKWRLQDDPHCLLAFVSPRGLGLKFFIKTPASKEQHELRYEGIKARYEAFLGVKLDPTCKNLSRVCFMSHDPSPHVNLEATECLDKAQPKVIFTPSSHGTDVSAEQTFQRAKLRAETVKGRSWNEGSKHAYLVSLIGICKAWGLSEEDFRIWGSDLIIDEAASKTVRKLFNFAT